MVKERNQTMDIKGYKKHVLQPLHNTKQNTKVLTQSILAWSGLAVRLCSGVHYARLLVVAAAAGAPAAVSSHAVIEVRLGKLSLTLQQGVWVTVWVPQH